MKQFVAKQAKRIYVKMECAKGAKTEGGRKASAEGVRRDKRWEANSRGMMKGPTQCPLELFRPSEEGPYGQWAPMQDLVWVLGHWPSVSLCSFSIFLHKCVLVKR